MSTWIDPLITRSLFNLVLIVVSILDVNKFSDAVVVSNEPNLPPILVISVFKLPVFISKDVSLPFWLVLVVLLDDVYVLRSPLNVVISESVAYVSSKRVIVSSTSPILPIKLPVVTSIPDNFVAKELV